MNSLMIIAGIIGVGVYAKIMTRWFDEPLMIFVGVPFVLFCLSLPFGLIWRAITL